MEENDDVCSVIKQKTTMTGFDFPTFDAIHHSFRYFYKNFSPHSRDGTIVQLYNMQNH